MATVYFPPLNGRSVVLTTPSMVWNNTSVSSLSAQACHEVNFTLLSTIRGNSIYLLRHHSVVLELPATSAACSLHETPTYLLALSQMGEAVQLNEGEVGNV